MEEWKLTSKKSSQKTHEEDDIETGKGDPNEDQENLFTSGQIEDLLRFADCQNLSFSGGF